ncbi:MAG: N-acetylmuramoyl-L-alanine amidase [Bacteroidetes bacterium]|nr:N-acetylmuramoyl-L-alanine amidase [Bacteroidota bacterium]MBS1756847.1 N-acetylmuramoyl-L-alanine amidase [Bacteroidota bacterium]
MLPLAYYTLKVIICSAILFGYYWFFLRNKIFHIYNRFYLLATVVLSLVLPLLKFNFYHSAVTTKTGVIHLLQLVNGSDEYMDEVVIQAHQQYFSKEQIMLILFISVSTFFAFLLVRSLLKIYMLKKSNPVQHFDGVDIINTNDKSTPFSFFKNIFWNNAIDIDSSNGQRILKHEIAHIRDKHSQDKLFLNIIMTVFWCNPVYWLIRKELNIIHEFLADKKAVEDGDTSAFAAMILQATYPGHHFEIANNFFYSPIKRRLAMLTKNNNKKVNYISRLLVLPLAFIVFAAFSLKAKNTPNVAILKHKPIIVVIDAGHGGMDAGATAIDGSAEKDINLALAKKIKELNTDENIKIILTRETDIYQNPRDKANIAKAYNADLFITVHGDVSPTTDKEKNSGLAVTISKNNFENSSQSRVLASALLSAFQQHYGLQVASNPEQRQMGIWVLQSNTFPSVLIHAGFLSNKLDLNYLKSNEGQNQFAINVLNGIENYISIKNNESENTTTTKIESPVTNQLPDTNTNPTFIKNVSISLNNSTKNVNQLLYIINGREYAPSEIKGKKITCSIGRIYGKNNAKMIAKYGDKARNGVMELDDAKIIDNVADDPVIVSDSIIFAKSEEEKNKTPINNITLYEVNGVEKTKEEISAIPPNNIQQINVIKGEAATAKYGSKASNGVIEIVLKDAADTTPVKDDKVFIKVEQEAQFPGGNGAWADYLRRNLNAITPAQEGWAEGTYTVNVRFIVDRSGTISDVVTNNHIGSKTAAECIRIIKTGPKWIPARQNGHLVTSYRIQPITFVVTSK